MVQESTMICVDNSEYMRNGDMSPNRMQCQQEAVRVLIQFKLRSNPENAIGMLSMAKNIDVLSSMTQEDRKVLARLHQVPIEGLSQVIRAIKTAHLVLKNRPNRNHKTRVVVFIGSPLDNIESDFGPGEMQKLAKKLKKENVKADFVLFGEATAENNQVILDFVDTLNGKDGSGSNVVVVPGDAKLFEALLSSPICRNEDGTGGGEFDFGMDGDDDPELALALRVSLEEQRQRQQAEVAANAPPTANGGETAQNMEVDQPAAENAQAAHASSGTAGGEQIATPLKIDSFDPAGMTEEEQIQWALRMSMAPDSPEGNINIPVTSTASNSGAGGTPAPTPMEAEMGEEESQKNRQHSTALGQLMENPELLKQLVDQIPGTTSAGKDKQKDEKKDTKDEDK